MKRENVPSRNATVAVACIATAMLMLDISVVNTALSDISESLDTGISGLKWLIDAYALPLAATVLTAGSIADRFGRRRLFVIGLAIFTAASAACGAAPTIELLVAGRAIQGLGASIMFATALALIGQVSTTADQRAKALAAFGAAIGAAFAIGPFVGGSLTEAFGWRAIFLVNVPIGLAALQIATRRVGEGRDPRPRRVDLPGQMLLISGLFLLVFALLRGNDSGWGSAEIVGTLAGAAVLLAAFLVVEHRSAYPMLPLGLLRQRKFAGPQIAVVGISASFFAGFLYMTLYLQGVLGLSPIQTGLAYLPGTFVVFLVSALSAQLATRMDPARIAVIGLAFVSIGMAVLLLADVGSSWTATLPGLLLASIGTGLFNPAGSSLALDALPPEQGGLASGANDTFRQAGVVIGVALLGTLVPDAPGRDPAAYVDGFHHALIVGAGIAAVCAAGTAALLLGRERRWQPAPELS
jgi:EmrB/QacA subfamily drug resistance transporter